jgi:hypothetical protein
MNILANALPLNGLNTGEISDRFKIFFVPAGYVFSIWFVIYVGLIAYGIYQIIPAQSSNETLQSIAWLFIASCIANVIWLFLWHYEQFNWTLFAMVALFLLLLMIYERLWAVRATADRSFFWAVQIPFSVYLGWITVATIANVTQVLYYNGWGGWGIADATWAAIMLVVATLVGILMILRRQDPAYALVLIWAFIGIANKHSTTALVANTAWITAAVLLLLAGYQIYRLISVPKAV